MWKWVTDGVQSEYHVAGTTGWHNTIQHNQLAIMAGTVPHPHRLEPKHACTYSSSSRMQSSSMCSGAHRNQCLRS